LLDLSCSMKGTPLEEAKKILLMCLNHMKQDWTFNILVFGSSKSCYQHINTFWSCTRGLGNTYKCKGMILACWLNVYFQFIFLVKAFGEMFVINFYPVEFLWTVANSQALPKFFSDCFYTAFSATCNAGPNPLGSNWMEQRVVFVFYLKFLLIWSYLQFFINTHY